MALLKSPCKHGYQVFDCEQCDPVPIAEHLLIELELSADALSRVRGHIPKCGNTCYCGYLEEKGDAEGRYSWATANAKSWRETQERKRNREASK